MRILRQMHGQARLRHLLDGHISSSREQAMREAAPHYEENMKMFGELRLVRALSDAQIAAMRDPRLAGTVKLPTIEDTVKVGGSLAGRPEDIVEQLKGGREALPRPRPPAPGRRRYHLRGTSMRDPPRD
jgi:hypothetical protein